METRRAEIEAILSARLVIRTAEAQPSVREVRLAILEELTQVSYPSATMLAAARQLAAEAGLRRAARSGRARPTRRARSPWGLLVAAIWGAVLALLVTGSGERAVGAWCTSDKLLVWAVFVVASGCIATAWVRWPRWRARAADPGATSRRLVTNREPSRQFHHA